MRCFSLIACLLTGSALAQDCNQNGVPDATDIANGTSGDCNSNGVPDDCEFGQVFLFEDYDGGANLPPGVTQSSTGLWHTTTQCRPAGSGSSGALSYFGIDAQCNFDDGGVPAGTYSMNGVTLPADSQIFLQYWSYYQGEGGGNVNCDPSANFDSATVLVNGATVDDHCDDPMSLEWRYRTVDLSAWSGQAVTIEWQFHAHDCFANGGYGWGVDDIRLVALGDASGNGVPDLCERISVTYCQSNPNSSGGVAGLAALGSETIADNDLFLRTVGAPQNVFGYYLMAQPQAQTPLPAPSQGILCLGFPLVRFSQPEFLLFSGTSGELRMRVDLMALPSGTVFQPGERWRFQCWFRDGTSSNTSRGVFVDFQ